MAVTGSWFEVGAEIRLVAEFGSLPVAVLVGRNWFVEFVVVVVVVANQ